MTRMMLFLFLIFAAFGFFAGGFGLAMYLRREQDAGWDDDRGPFPDPLLHVRTVEPPYDWERDLADLDAAWTRQLHSHP